MADAKIAGELDETKESEQPEVELGIEV